MQVDDAQKFQRVARRLLNNVLRARFAVRHGNRPLEAKFEQPTTWDRLGEPQDTLYRRTDISHEDFFQALGCLRDARDEIERLFDRLDPRFRRSLGRGGRRPRLRFGREPALEPSTACRIRSAAGRLGPLQCLRWPLTGEAISKSAV